MKCRTLIAALAACTVSLSLANAANAVEKSNPDEKDGGWGGAFGSGPGPGDPSLGGSTMPPGGDKGKEKEADRHEKAAERKRKEAERKKKEAEKASARPPAVKPTDRVNDTVRNTPAASHTPPRSTTVLQTAPPKRIAAP
jgi:hypothetical protein